MAVTLGVVDPFTPPEGRSLSPAKPLTRIGHRWTMQRVELSNASKAICAMPTESPAVSRHWRRHPIQSLLASPDRQLPPGIPANAL